MTWLLDRARRLLQPHDHRGDGAADLREQHLRELERRVRALDAQMGAREDERTKARHQRDQEAYRVTR